MANSSQKRAIENYRNRLRKRGITRFEVLGLITDRELIRSLAKRLTENGEVSLPHEERQIIPERGVFPRQRRKGGGP